MLSFRLDTLPAKELFKDVVVKLVSGDELTLNYFELRSEDVKIPFHEHPVEHLVVVLEGELEFLFEGSRLSLKEKEGVFVSAGTRHSARAVHAPVRALEIYAIAEDPYYQNQRP